MTNEHYLPLDHARFKQVASSIFTRRLARDCMQHRCAMVDEGREKIDACCQYGCDVDLAEREAILAKREDLRALLREPARDAEWFASEEEIDADYPSGRCVRTKTLDGGCIFLAHDQRGCGIHRASIERGWDVRGIKPAVCRLYPLTYFGTSIEIAEEYAEYSCAHVVGPTLYRLARDTIADLFGQEAVDALDRVERLVLADASGKQPSSSAAKSL